PYFIDDRSDAVGNPVVEYIRRALRSISSNYKYEDLMAFVRCPLISGTAKEKEDADKFDNFLRKTGLRGRTALKSGKLDYDFGLLTSLEDGLKAANDIAGMTEALKAFCLASELKSRADSFSDNTEALGFARQADECRRFTKLIPELFDRMTIVLGDEQCSVNDYIRLIDAGFHEIKGGMIPETMDMVMIGDLKRSRFDDIDVLYVLGANDGNIPSEVSGGGIFTDFERGIIQSTNIELAPDDKLDSCIQHFYLKLLLNKPNKRLVITYARTGRDNKGLKPSSMLDELENKVYGEFDSISSMLGDQTEVISSKEDALMSFAGGLSKIRKEDDRAVSIYKALSRGGMKAELDKILAAAFLEHKLDKIPEETAAELYNDVLRGSVTRIENFEACPFVHFIQHGLGLREREEHSFEVLDAGNVFHEALDRIFRHIRREKKDIVSIEAEELEAICNSEIDSVINEYNDGIMNSSMRIKYFANKIRKITNKTVTVLRTQLSDGDFRNAETEAVFSFRDGNLDLHGKIDRIDECDTDGRTLVKIIDYKSGKKEFSISRLADGLELQLVTYMGSAVKKISDLKGKDAEVVPAGMFYYHIADPEIKYEPGLHRDNIDDKKLAELKMNGAMIADTRVASHVDHRLDGEAEEIDKNAVRQSGVVSSNTELLSRDEFETLIKYASDKIRSDARDILSGDINIRPLREANKEKCRYCSFHGICRFDTGIPGFE
ncbi:MAG: PD-(D/E)XK nuclease family protein, partial [Eubacteriales bacterium]|nr:PD-(D/E)XK nuclease family protein [Eubacteriales bacterium]